MVMRLIDSLAPQSKLLHVPFHPGEIEQINWCELVNFTNLCNQNNYMGLIHNHMQNFPFSSLQL
jgi:hypothetical protein